MRDLKVGDIIHCQGLIVEIAKINYQEPWEWRKSYYIEFYDTDGHIRSWKQEYDGGYAELKGE